MMLLGAACTLPNGDGTQDRSSGDAGGRAADAGAADGRVPRNIVPAPSWESLPAPGMLDVELADLPRREAQYAKLCATPHHDTFFEIVCGDVRPNIPDFAGLLQLVGLDRDRAFALTGNSTSLVAMNVTPLNPRILVFPRVDDGLEKPAELIALGFARGDQFVEIASRDRATDEPNFYLLTFEQSCSYEKGGCDLAHLLTEEVEHDWTAYSIYSEADLAATSIDCHTCHQPRGFGTEKMLRMQELSSPWTHWFPQRFVQRSDSDRVLSAQFMAAHDLDKQYGGVPTSTIANAIDEGSAAQLEALIRAEGNAEQPNVFDPRIEGEARDGGVSVTWQAQFDKAVQGKSIAVPYPRVDVTDEDKRLTAARSYRDVVKGAAARDTLVDTRDVFSQDAREKLGFVPQPAATGAAVLVQMCSRCHDGRADPALGRARFNVQKLDKMTRGEKDLAIARIELPSASKGKMPPWRAGRLTDDATRAAVTELRK